MAFDLGFERAGIKTVWQVEIDPFCRKVLERHWPNVQRFEDVRTVRDLPRVSVITGGFPCQDISVIGPQAGIDGDRSGLWREMLRVICEVRPDFAVVENVAALTFRGLGRVLGDLAAAGFDAEWHCLPAIVAGLPHYRDRIWIVAHPAKKRMGGRQGDATFGDAPTFAMPPQRDRIADWKDVLGEFNRMDDGLSGRAHRDRGKALGNSLVPQIAEWIGRRIVEAHERSTNGERE